jgi:peptide/nickel transport system permease protein
MKPEGWSTWLGVSFVLVVALVTLAAPVISSHQPLTVHSAEEFLSPNGRYPLGTDSFGRDVLSRALWGGRASLFNAAVATAVAVAIGMVAGGMAGMMGAWPDWGLMRAVDVMLSIPGLLLAIALVALLGVGETQAAFAVGLSLAPGFARVVRAAVISVLQQEYIEAARAIGATRLRIFVKHVLPNISTQVVGFAVVNFGWALLNLATLDFLGLSGAVSDPTWGRMLAEGRRYLRRAPWIALVPGGLLVTVMAGITIASDTWRRRAPGM